MIAVTIAFDEIKGMTMADLSDVMNIAGEMQLENVHISFNGKKVLENLSLTVKRNSFTCVCGPSGCGKTTIMHILAGYQKPDSGECTFNGLQVDGPSPSRLTVFQENSLFAWMSVIDNILFGPRLQGKDLKKATFKAESLLEMTGLVGFEKKYPGQLSGGMQRRVELIRALINEPQILLLDEPFRGLDAMTRGLMQEYFLKVFETSGITMLLITSELDEAIYMGDTVYLLSAIPAKTNRVLSVPIPRPRTIEHQTSLEFAQLQTEAFKTLEKEALKSFERMPSPGA